MDRRGFFKLLLAAIGLWAVPKVAEVERLGIVGDSYNVQGEDWYYDEWEGEWHYNGPLYLRHIFRQDFWGIKEGHDDFAEHIVAKCQEI